MRAVILVVAVVRVVAVVQVVAVFRVVAVVPVVAVVLVLEVSVAVSVAADRLTNITLLFTRSFFLVLVHVAVRVVAVFLHSV
jgi:hypothetical protein